MCTETIVGRSVQVLEDTLDSSVMNECWIVSILAEFGNGESKFRAACDHSPNEFTDGTTICKLTGFESLTFRVSCGCSSGIKRASVVIVSSHRKGYGVHIRPTVIVNNLVNIGTDM